MYVFATTILDAVRWAAAAMNAASVAGERPVGRASALFLSDRLTYSDPPINSWGYGIFGPDSIRV